MKAQYNMRDQYSKGQPVEIRQQNGSQHFWRKARIEGSTGRGAHVKFEDRNDGRVHHILFKDIRPAVIIRPLKPPVQIGTPVLTAEEIDLINAKEAPVVSKQLALVPPPLNIAPSISIGGGRAPRQRTMTPVGAYLRNARTERGLSQAQVAQKLGVHNQYVSKWEIGDWRPNDDVLLAYVQNFDLNLDDLLRLRDNSSFEKMARGVQVDKPVAPVILPNLDPPTFPESETGSELWGAQLNRFVQLKKKRAAMAKALETLQAEIKACDIEIEAFKAALKEVLE